MTGALRPVCGELDQGVFAGFSRFVGIRRGHSLHLDSLPISKLTDPHTEDVFSGLFSCACSPVLSWFLHVLFHSLVVEGACCHEAQMMTSCIILHKPPPSESRLPQPLLTGSKSISESSSDCALDSLGFFLDFLEKSSSFKDFKAKTSCQVAQTKTYGPLWTY